MCTSLDWATPPFLRIYALASLYAPTRFSSILRRSHNFAEKVQKLRGEDERERSESLLVGGKFGEARVLVGSSTAIV